MFIRMRCMGSRFWAPRSELNNFGTVVVFSTEEGAFYSSIRWSEQDCHV